MPYDSSDFEQQLHLAIHRLARRALAEVARKQTSAARAGGRRPRPRAAGKQATPSLRALRCDAANLRGLD